MLYKLSNEMAECHYPGMAKQPQSWAVYHIKGTPAKLVGDP